MGRCSHAGCVSLRCLHCQHSLWVLVGTWGAEPPREPIWKVGTTHPRRALIIKQAPGSDGCSYLRSRYKYRPDSIYGAPKISPACLGASRSSSELPGWSPVSCGMGMGQPQALSAGAGSVWGRSYGHCLSFALQQEPAPTFCVVQGGCRGCGMLSPIGGTGWELWGSLSIHTPLQCYVAAVPSAFLCCAVPPVVSTWGDTGVGDTSSKDSAVLLFPCPGTLELPHPY